MGREAVTDRSFHNPVPYLLGFEDKPLCGSLS